MTFRPYIWGVATAAVFITGVLWYSRNGAGVNGEDMAAILAAQTERKCFAYAYGTNHVVISTNQVTAYIDGDQLKSVISGYRDLLDEGVDFAGDDNDYYGANLHWLDVDQALPANNGQVSGFADDYYSEWSHTNYVSDGVTEVFWHLAPFHGGYPFFLTLDTRYTNSVTPKVRLFYGLAVPNVPAVTWFYDTDMDASTVNLLWGGVGNWWTYAGLGTNLYLMPSMEYVGTNGAVHYSAYIATNTLNSIRTVATAMSRSARVFDYPFSGVFTATSGVRVAGSGDTNGNSDVTVSAIASAAEALAVASQTTSSGVAFDGNLAEIQLDATRQVSVFTDPDETEYQPFATCSFEKTMWLGLKCVYPSEAACASGLVSRIRIYAVAEGLFGRRLEYTATNATSYTPDDGFISLIYDDKNLGTGLKLGDHAWNGHDSSSATVFNTYRGSGFDNCVRHYWTLVCDVSDPTTRPLFSLGSAFDPTSVSAVQNVALSTGAAGYPSRLLSWSINVRKYQQKVEVRHIFLIVDWKWRLFGPAPFVPVNHTPEWASTNTP